MCKRSFCPFLGLALLPPSICLTHSTVVPFSQAIPVGESVGFEGLLSIRPCSRLGFQFCLRHPQSEMGTDEHGGGLQWCYLEQVITDGVEHGLSIVLA